jgi:hypothetical protein
MKALVDHLEWVKLYINGTLGNRDDPKLIQIAQDEWIAANAIAEALPEFVISSGPPARKVPDPIIKLS